MWEGYWGGTTIMRIYKFYDFLRKAFEFITKLMLENFKYIGRLITLITIYVLYKENLCWQ